MANPARGSILSVKPQMRTSTIRIPNTTPTYSASVPLSAYRKLVAQLQAAETKLDSLNAQNQQLATENQQLRQKIDQAVQSLHLQQSTAPAPIGSRKYAYNPPKIKAEPSYSGLEPRPTTRRRSPVIKSALAASATKEAKAVTAEIFTIQEEGRYRRSQPDASEISGRSLAIAILLIMVTAFGAGYLLTRPLLPQTR